MDILAFIASGSPVELWGVVLICVLVFIAGFVDAIAGGGGLISLPAYLFAGLPVHTAIATNKLSSTMGTAVATWRYFRQGYMVWKLALPSVACGLVGSALGANLTLAVSDQIIRVFMLIVIPIAGYYVLRTKDFDSHAEERPFRTALAICMVIAFFIGMYDGFYGPGTGTFLMILLTAVAHLHTDKAAGITKAVNLTTNVSALVVFLVNGAVLVPLGLLAGVFSIVGNYLGASLFTQRGAAVVRPVILVVLIVFAVRLIAELAGIV